MAETLMLIDGASLWYRAFHGVPDSLTSPAGEPVNAVRGFIDMLASLIARESPARVAVCLDWAWRPRFRVEAVPSYKAHRAMGGEPFTEAAPAGLGRQVDEILSLVESAGIATAGAVECEADDVMGTLAHRESRDDVLVVSGDRDLLQVVRPEPTSVEVLYVGRGLAKAQRWDADSLAARYGLPRNRPGAAYAELALLRGDPSDGLPGVAGIGEKTAARLLGEYGDIRTVREAARDPGSALTPRLRARILAADDYLDAALPVVRVRADAPVQWTPRFAWGDALPREPVDGDAFTVRAERLGVDGSARRLARAMATR